MNQKIVLEGENLQKFYSLKSFFHSRTTTIRAVDDVSFKLAAGETLSIVGESGSGKSTIGRLATRLESPTSGQIKVLGKLGTEIPEKSFRNQIQIIFQDPYSSLNPRKKAWQIVAEPLLVNGNNPKNQLKDKALRMMERVGLRTDQSERYPHMFSGGQRQRLGIARALILRPKIIICDEPVSALDVSIQAQIINLLMDLKDELELSYLFIAHDLSVVRFISDKILVLYLGKIVEFATKKDLFENPIHPYTQGLLASIPSVKVSTNKKESEAIRGELPSPSRLPKGCSFQTRCPHVMDQCRQLVPPLKEIRKDHLIACHLISNNKPHPIF